MNNHIPLILISGSTGFIGSRLFQRLSSTGNKNLRRLTRRAASNPLDRVASLLNFAELVAACADVGTIFHCAGHAHSFSSLANAESEKHWRVNFEGTRNLVEAAGQVGVQRFIFLSSVKAMGEPGKNQVDENYQGQVITAYGQSKRAAENAVLAAGDKYGMHVVNLRLAMVYGHGSRGNLERMGRLVRLGLFPPLPETGNHRSLVHVDDVITAMLHVADNDRAKGETYIIASPHAPSGHQIYNAMRSVLGLRPCRWALPEPVFRRAAKCGDGLSKLLQRQLPLNSEVVDRLLGSAWYSPAKVTEELGWQANIPLSDGLEEMFAC